MNHLTGYNRQKCSFASAEAARNTNTAPAYESSNLINVTTDASEAAMEKVKADLHRFCPVSKVIRNAGTELEEVWNVTRP